MTVEYKCVLGMIGLQQLEIPLDIQRIILREYYDNQAYINTYLPYEHIDRTTGYLVRYEVSTLLRPIDIGQDNHSKYILLRDGSLYYEVFDSSEDYQL